MVDLSLYINGYLTFPEVLPAVDMNVVFEKITAVSSETYVHIEKEMTSLVSYASAFTVTLEQELRFTEVSEIKTVLEETFVVNTGKNLIHT